MEIGTTVGPRPERVESTPEVFSFVELSVGEGEIPPESVDATALKEALDTRNLNLTVHLPFRQPLVTSVEAFNDAQRRYLDSLLETTAAWGAEKAVVHATVRDPRHGRDDVPEDVIRRQLRDVSRAGDDHGVEVCFENVGNFRSGVDLPDLGALVADVGGSVCFDVGHAHREGGQEAVEAFLDRYGDLLAHLHVHDVRRRGDTHIPVGSGDVDFDTVGERLAGFDGTVAVEVFTDDTDYLTLSAEKFAACL